MARKVNLNSKEIFSKLGTPSMTPRTTTAMYSISKNCRRSSSLNNKSPQLSPEAKKQVGTGIPSQTCESSCWPVQTSPIVHSKIHRIRGPDLSKTTGRGFMGIYSKNQHNREYNPNYKAVWKGTGKKIMKFEATLARREFFRQPDFIVECKNVNYSQVDSNMQVPNLRKTTSRSTDEEVPTFMVSLHYLDRVCGHTVPNYKSLKMNNYMTTNFLPLTSSFDLSSKCKTGSKNSSPLGKYE